MDERNERERQQQEEPLEGERELTDLEIQDHGADAVKGGAVETGPYAVETGPFKR